MVNRGTALEVPAIVPPCYQSAPKDVLPETGQVLATVPSRCPNDLGAVHPETVLLEIVHLVTVRLEIARRQYALRSGTCQDNDHRGIVHRGIARPAIDRLATGLLVIDHPTAHPITAGATGGDIRTIAGVGIYILARTGGRGRPPEPSRVGVSTRSHPNRSTTTMAQRSTTKVTTSRTTERSSLRPTSMLSKHKNLPPRSRKTWTRKR